MKSTITGFLMGVALLLLAAPLSGQAQQAGKVARLGVLLFGTPEGDPNVIAFRQGLSELGYVEGKNLTTVYRYAEGKPERLAGLANELVALKPDVILALGGDVAPFARTATNAIPISWKRGSITFSQCPGLLSHPAMASSVDSVP